MSQGNFARPSGSNHKDSNPNDPSPTTPNPPILIFTGWGQLGPAIGPAPPTLQMSNPLLFRRLF